VLDITALPAADYTTLSGDTAVQSYRQAIFDYLAGRNLIDTALTAADFASEGIPAGER
jgi:hypothetical protein